MDDDESDLSRESFDKDVSPSKNLKLSRQGSSPLSKKKSRYARHSMKIESNQVSPTTPYKQNTQKSKNQDILHTQ